MPSIKLLHVCSSSSEDPNHPASNLLNSDTYRKWACATGGEKQVVVVLQLEKSTNIHAIDIGNNGSAFVEVLAGRSTSPDEYQVLLVSSTFMSPADSKSWTNTNRVRMFGKDKLCKGVAEQKWDRVKIVCTQPYNKTEKYGLTFVKFHSQPEGGDVVSEEGKIGAFKLREEVKDLPPGSFFFRKEQQDKEEKQVKPVVTAAAQARMASAAALKDDSASSSTVTKAPPPNVSSSPAKVLANVKVDVGHSAELVDKPLAKVRAEPVDKPLAKVRAEPVDKPLAKVRAEPVDKPLAKRPVEGKTLPAKKVKVDGSSKPKDVPYAEIMSGVVFVLSGFKNPYRTELRDKAIAMGARYEGDWGPGCTHLVCAFSNTPKFSQVKAQKGLIVKKEWILECHKTKQRLPAKQFRLSSGSDDSEAEDERYDKEEEKIYQKEKQNQDGGTAGRDQDGAAAETSVSSCAEETPTVPCVKEEDPYGGSTDEEMEEEVIPNPTISSEDDNTDEEIQRIKQQAENRGGCTAEDPCTQGTEEQPTSSDKSLTNLPDFFSKCHFFLYGNFSPSDRRLLVRYITAYNGSVKDYMDGEVTHVITQELWDDKFDQALLENNLLVFVKPKWLFVCHQKQACIPCQPYLVVAT